MTPVMEMQRAAIIGATGSTGIHLARELVRRGTPVRVLSRSAANLERAFATLDVERVEADAVDVEAVRRGIADCDVHMQFISEILGQHVFNEIGHQDKASPGVDADSCK